MSVTKQKAKSILDGMSIEEQVGQLFILAFPGKDPRILAELVEEYGIAGSYISQDNATNFSEARELCRSLQSYADKKHKDLPLILGVDQEGAWGVLIPDSTIGPGNLALGISDNTEYTSAMYRIFAEEMRHAGYQAILGPCADINLNPKNPIIGTRSFGEDTRRVALHVQAAIEAVHSQGLLAAAKHFPGHGDTFVDTHRDIPVVDKDMDRLLTQELFPFQAAINSGVDMIMTSHIRFPHLDAQFPATLSQKILGDLLRKKMGFRGLVITDSMNMGAIKKHYSPEDASIRAFLAGADLIMLSEEHYDHNEEYLENQKDSIRGIVKAVRDGRIPQTMLREKVLRVLEKRLQLQERLQEGRQESPQGKPQPQGEGRRATSREPYEPREPYESRIENKEIERSVARAAIRVIRNKNKLIPFQRGQSIAVINATPQASYHNLVNARGIGPNQALSAFASFSALFSQCWEQTQIFSCEDLQANGFQASGSRANGSRASEERGVLDSFDRIIVVTEDYPLPGEDFEKKKQQDCVRKLIQTQNEKLVVVGLRSPYELDEYPDLSCYVSSYSSRTCSALAAAELLASLDFGN